MRPKQLKVIAHLLDPKRSPKSGLSPPSPPSPRPPPCGAMSLPDMGLRSGRSSNRSYARSRSRSEIEGQRTSRSSQYTGRSHSSVGSNDSYGFGSSSSSRRQSGTRYAPWVSKAQWDPHHNERPMHRTVTELKEARALAMKPDKTFDVDGDGVVSSQDLFYSKKFDDDGNGVLDEDERRELRKAMVNTAIAKYRRLPRGRGKDTEEMIKAFTKHLDDTVDRPDFLERFNALQIQTMISSTADSTKMETVLQPLIVDQRDKLISAFTRFDENGDGVVSHDEFRTGILGVVKI
jgi:Ca2+-binding EF-hand superfamily protein